jgi:endonuclease G
LQQIITVTGAGPADDPLLFGNPSGATANVANENNYLMVKPQYTLSYNRSKATANWVAWRLDASWIGTAPRQDDFRPDPALPSNWYHVTDADYSGSGYDRGHMCPSGDRTNTIPNNSATFLMTNMVPQSSENNQGPWADFENYCRTLAQAGSEIYIISGPVGNAGTIASGRVVVPTKTWKVVLILPNGNNDLQRVTRATRAFGIIIPNVPPPVQSTLWRQYRTTVDAVELLTGYNFFSNIPINTQSLIERKRDRL